MEINSTFYVSTIVPLNFFNYTNFNDSFMKIITGNCYRVLTEQQLWYCFIDKNTHYAKICAMVSVIKETECTNARNGVEPVNINFYNCTFLPLYMYLFPVIVQCLIRQHLARLQRQLIKFFLNCQQQKVGISANYLFRFYFLC